MTMKKLRPNMRTYRTHYTQRTNTMRIDSAWGASLRAETVNIENRSVGATITTENPVTVRDFVTWDPIDEILLSDGASLPNKAPFLDSHFRNSFTDALGSAREMKIENDEVVGRLFFAKRSEKAQEAWDLVEDKHIDAVSVGARIDSFVDINPGDTQNINGRSFTAGKLLLRVVTKWTLREVSLVLIGADDQARIRAEINETGMVPQERIKPMNEETRKFLVHLGLRADATEEQAQAFLIALAGEERARADAVGVGEQTCAQAVAAMTTRAVVTPVTPVQPTVDPVTVAREAVRAERERVTEIQSMGTDEIHAATVKRAIAEEWPVDRARKVILEELQSSRQSAPGGTFNIHGQTDNKATSIRALEAGLSMRAGVNVIDAHAVESKRKQQEDDADRGHQYSDMSLQDVIRQAIFIETGKHVNGRGDILRAAMSSASVVTILSNVAGKSFMQKFMEVVDSTAGWVAEKDVPNFKTQTLTKLSKQGGLKLLPPGDTAEHVTYTDTGETFNLSRYAKMWTIDEQTVINDDMDAFNQVPGDMAMAAARLRPDSIYAMMLNNPDLADGVALYHAATHRNLATGALTAATLQVGIAAMMKQYETVGKEKIALNVNTKHLIVPTDLKFAAEIILKSAERVVASSSGGTFNPLKDIGIEIHSDARLGTIGAVDPKTGTSVAGTATNWFLAADSALAPTFVCAYLSGRNRLPTIRQFNLSKGQWGMGFDVEHDIAVAPMAFQGVYKSTGAA